MKRLPGWDLLAFAIMPNHVHLVVRVPGDPAPEKLLGDFKSYGSRCLNKIAGKPSSGTWWTANGSTRKLADVKAVQAVIMYVRNQRNPLLVWGGEPGGASPRILETGKTEEESPG